jgi:hypothetical protein
MRPNVKVIGSDGNWQSGIPTENGIYERCFGDSILSGKSRTVTRFCKFKDGTWYCFGYTIEDARAEEEISGARHLKWRKIPGETYA